MSRMRPPQEMLHEDGKVERVGVGNADVRVGSTLYRSVLVDPSLPELIQHDDVMVSWANERPRIISLVSDRAQVADEGVTIIYNEAESTTPIIQSVADPEVEPLTGDTWQHSGDMYIYPTSTSATTLYIDNPDGGGLTVDVDGDLTISGTLSAGGITPGNITMADDAWIGLGASAGRVVFDNQTPDKIKIEDAYVGIGMTPTSSLNIDQSGAGIQASFILRNTQAAATDVGSRIQYVGVGGVSQAYVFSAWEGAATTDAYLGISVRDASSVTEKLRVGSDRTEFYSDIHVLGDWMVGQDATGDSTNKSYRLGVAHYTNGEEPLVGMVLTSTGSSGYVNIGGATSLGNTATSVNIYAASDTTTLTGSQIARFDVGGFELYSGYANITTSGGALELAPTTSVVLDPGDQQVLPGSTHDDDLGAYNVKWRTLYAAELYVENLVAQDVLATIGGQIIVAPTTKLIAAANNSQTTIDVEHQNLHSSGPVGKFVLLQTAPGGVAQFEVMLTADANPTPITGGYRYTVTRDEDGSGANSWEIGDAVVSLGKTAGEGYIEITSTETAHAELGPNITIYSRTGTTDWEDDNAPVVSLGNLDSFLGYGAEFGLAMGNDLSEASPASDAFIGATLDQTNGLRLFNTDLAVYSGSSNVFLVDSSAISLALGATLPTGPLTNDTGIWMGKDGSDYEMRVGVADGTDLTSGMHWDGSALQIIGDLVIGPGVGFAVDDALLYLPWDGPRPYETDYQVNTVGHLGQVATISGGIIGRPGQFGKGVQVARGTTNLEVNPSFEIDTTGWTASGTNTIAQSSEQALYGSYSCKCTYQDNVVFMYDSITLTAAQHFVTARVYVPSNWDGGDVYISFANYTSASETEHRRWESGDGNDVWYLLVSEITPDAGDLVGEVRVRTDSAPTAGRYIYVDAVQIEQKDWHTPYCDGSLGDGHSWSGTAHASTSTRVVCDYDFTISGWSMQQGSMGAWIEMGMAYDTSKNPRIFNLMSGASRVADLWYQSTNDKFGFYDATTAVILYCDDAQTFDAGDKIHLMITWDADAGSKKMYINGQLAASSSPSAWTVLVPDMLHIGHFNDETTQFDGVLDEFIVLPRELSASEIRAIYESGAPLQISTNKFELMLTEVGAGKVIGSGAGLYGYDDAGGECFALSTVDSVTWGARTLNTGDMLIGDPDAGHMMWDQSAGQLLFRDGATVEAYVGTDGKIYAGGGNVWLDVDGLFGQSSASNECFALVTDDSTSWGGQTLNAGDVLIGDPSNANVFWDQSTGKLQFRDTSTMQVEMGTDGKLYAGGGDVWLDSDGLKFLSGVGIGHSVNWYDSDGDRMVYMYATGNYDSTEVQSLWYAYSDGQNCQTNMGAIRNGTGADSCDFKLYTYGPSGNNYSALLTTAAAAPDFIVHTDGAVMISGTESQSNSHMTIGLTINQGANSDDILSFKSSLIAHGITTLTETDTYASMNKASADYGGLRIWAYAETGIDYGFLVQSTVTDEDTTTPKTTSSLANIIEGASLKSGTTYGSHASNANLWAVRNYTATQFVIEGNGDYHYNGSGTSYDRYDDAHLVRALDLATSATAIRSQFDAMLRYKEHDLIEAGVLGAPRAEGGLINGAQVQRLLMGATWQNYERQVELERKVEELTAELAATRKLLEVN